jgi:hypothetical protein
VAFEQRQPINYLSTSLIVAASITDTTMRANGFTSLDSPLGQKYVALVLHDDAANVFEVVWTSGHTASSDTITVVRGKEGTTARAWPAGTRVECAPTVYDALYPSITPTLPIDGPIGQRSMRGDVFDTVEKTKGGYWAPSVGVALAADVGPNMSSTSPSGGDVLLLRAQYVSPRTTDGTGKTTVNWKSPFPNNCLGAWATSVDNSHIGPYVVASNTATACTIYVFNGSAVFTTQTNVSFMLFGIGW